MSDQSRRSAATSVSQWEAFVLVPGVYVDKIGIEAAEMLLRNIRHNGCVDEFLQDQVSHLLTPDL